MSKKQEEEDEGGGGTTKKKCFLVICESRNYRHALLYQIHQDKQWMNYFHISHPSIARHRQLRCEVQEFLGKGAQGSVYKGIQKNSNGSITVLAIKLFKHTRHATSIRKEIKMLSNLQGSLFVIPLLGFVEQEDEKQQESENKQQSHITHALFPYISCYRATPSPILAVSHIRWIAQQLFLGLRDCHSRGIIHGDVKPSNVLIEDKTYAVKLIDFGHAQFYLPKHTYSTRLGTVGFRAPELLLEYSHVHYAIDMWSAGCVILELLLPHFSPMFRSKTNYEHLAKLNERFGTSALQQLGAKYGIREYEFATKVVAPKTWIQMLEHYHWGRDASREEECLQSKALDLIYGLLELDPQKRLTVDEALQHPFLLPTAQQLAPLSIVSTT